MSPTQKPPYRVPTMEEIATVPLNGFNVVSPLVGALQALVTSKWTSQVVNGQTILSTSEAGGSVTFTFDRAYTAADLATMAEEALGRVNTLVDPENPPLDVPRYNRLHPTFQ